MRLIVTALLTAGLTAAAMADAEKGRTMLEEVAKSYQSAPTITDTIVLSLGAEETTLRLRFDGKSRMQFDVPGFAVMRIDNQLIAVSDAVGDKYLGVEIENTLSETMTSIFGSPESLPYHFAMRDQLGIDQYINSLTLGFLQGPRITGFTQAGSGDDARHRIHLSDGVGTAVVYIHPSTRMITKIQTELPPPPGFDEEKLVAVITTKPVVADALAEPITFDPGDRTKVDSPDQLVVQLIEVGATAPNFTLADLDGKEVSLEKLRGRVVVLDFWATWCVPCIMAMPEIDRYAEWAKEQELPVNVYAVNVWEYRASGPSERKEMVQKFWKEREFKLTNLMDLDDQYVGKLGIDTLPTTIIIDGNGKVSSIHVGYSSNMFDILKESVANALQAERKDG